MRFTTRGPTSPAAITGMRTDIAGRIVENEDLVNLPNWLPLEFRIGEEDWFDHGGGHDPSLCIGRN